MLVENLPRLRFDISDGHPGSLSRPKVSLEKWAYTHYLSQQRVFAHADRSMEPMRRVGAGEERKDGRKEAAEEGRAEGGAVQGFRFEGLGGKGRGERARGQSRRWRHFHADGCSEEDQQTNAEERTN